MVGRALLTIADWAFTPGKNCGASLKLQYGELCIFDIKCVPYFFFWQLSFPTLFFFFFFPPGPENPFSWDMALCQRVVLSRVDRFSYFQSTVDNQATTLLLKSRD